MKSFTRKQRLQSHLERKIPCKKIIIKENLQPTYSSVISVIAENICNGCGKKFTRKDSLDRHIKNHCKNTHQLDNIKTEVETPDPIKTILNKLSNQMSEMREFINHLKNTEIFTNNLNN